MSLRPVDREYGPFYRAGPAPRAQSFSIAPTPAFTAFSFMQGQGSIHEEEPVQDEQQHDTVPGDQQNTTMEDVESDSPPLSEYESDAGEEYIPWDPVAQAQADVRNRARAARREAKKRAAEPSPSSKDEGKKNVRFSTAGLSSVFLSGHNFPPVFSNDAKEPYSPVAHMFSAAGMGDV
jgi:hypothetical protein